MFNNNKRKLCTSQNVKSNTGCKAVMRTSNFYHPSTLDDFYFQKRKMPRSGNDSLRHTSDIYMLFNQRRLDKMTREALIDHFNSMSLGNDALSQLRSKMTDEQLISLVKSRYIQSPSELMKWSQYLNSLADEKLQEYTVALESQKSNESPAVTVVPPTAADAK